MGTTTIRVSEAFRDYVKAHSEADESMEDTLRRLLRGPHPSAVAGLLTESEADAAKSAVDRLRRRDGDRLDRARETFADGADE